MKNIHKKTLSQLKSAAYDETMNIQVTQQNIGTLQQNLQIGQYNLGFIQQEIAERMQEKKIKKKTTTKKIVRGSRRVRR